ncbi:hypothetical protein LEN26_019545 [Aphanomyces euteiches]|nr:hypothetical protein LEN26_019545 [Aphanomyces euteiches]KAH9113319.1 hypothetical protein AeMF1_012467 [Aphanomyces euteiches]KAH9185159.1 hypothetical protein AeNC1_012864 [Aphanomyces euteiches]
MEAAATRQHAHPNTVYHCLYGYYHLGYPKQILAHVYNKTENTDATADDKAANHPLAYLDEAQDAFQQKHGIAISKTSVWQIVHDLGLTWKVLERRAMHVKERDICRFADELSHINWLHQNVVFLDEVAFDNRGMIRRRGYAIRGKKVAVRGDFQRKPRISILAFIGVGGVIDYFNTDGTFDRAEFTRCCQDFSTPRKRAYNSTPVATPCGFWMVPRFIDTLRFPTEFLFGYMKKAFQRHYVEGSDPDLLPFVVQTFRRFERFSMGKVFEHCGWMRQGFFNPEGPLSRQVHSTSNLPHDELGFVELEHNE